MPFTKTNSQLISALVSVLVLAACAAAQNSPKPLSGTLAASSQVETLHTVILSWSASIPASASPRDSVTGYTVYRSTTLPVASVAANRIDCEFISSVSCVDKNVVAGQTYYYIATALVGAPGSVKESVASQPPLKVTIPLP